MRRLLSTMLVWVVALPLLAAFLPASAFIGRQTQLPLCCRRAGAHHCDEMSAPQTGSAVVRAVCTAFPGLERTLEAGAWSFAAVMPPAGATPPQAAAVGQVEAGFRIASLRSRQKRGPPGLRLTAVQEAYPYASLRNDKES